MYTMYNYRTKKDLKEAVAQRQEVRIWQPGGIFKPAEADAHYSGSATVEGPHYPQPHTWYAQVQLVDGLVVKVK